MAQTFSKQDALKVRLFFLIVFALAVVAVLAWRGTIGLPAPLNEPIQQPVPFSHAHHAGDDGFDCRYCHFSVETSATAGMPSTQLCMTCHSRLFTDQPVLQPVVDSFRSGRPLHWNRIYDLPDFVYFNHSIHIHKGIGCVSCHGQVDEMPLMMRVVSLNMQWCLDCHRHPERHIRPRDQVFNLHWRPPADRIALGLRLVQEYRVRVGRITDCSICHR